MMIIKYYLSFVNGLQKDTEKYCNMRAERPEQWNLK
jgi:hypothetical protein